MEAKSESIEPRQPLKIQIIVAAFPPKLDGIGDYTALLAAELAKLATVEILTGSDAKTDSIPDVIITKAFSAGEPRSVWNLLPAIEVAGPDWVLLQYNPFSYGKWGRNLHLSRVMRQIRHRSPGTKIAIMFHEMFVPLTSWQFVVMSAWQRWQFWRLAFDADATFFSVGVWADMARRWRRGRPTVHLPVASNIPHVEISRDEARARLGIPDDRLVLGVFGSAHVERMLDWVRDAVAAACSQGQDVTVLYIGGSQSAVAQALGEVSLIGGGPFDPDEVSRRFAAMDLYLSPFSDGVSTRRGSMMTSLQHGVPAVGTTGYRTDAMLREQNGRAILLADVTDQPQFLSHVRMLCSDDEMRHTLGAEGQKFYERNFSWDIIASKMLDTMQL